MMIDNAFPNALGFLQAYTSGMSDYSQSGDVIPDLRLQNKYAQEFGGPLVGEQLISGTPSFDLNLPKTPLGQSFEGVPNASPEMLRKLMQKKLKNPGGREDLPGFLKGA
jgi:hypothetical protein